MKPATMNHNELMGAALLGASAAEVLRELVEVADDAIFVCDRDWRVLSWGPGAVRLFGRAPGEALAKPLAGMVTPGSAPKLRSALEQVEGGAEVRQLQLEALRADGLVVPVSLSMRGVFGSAGERTGAVVVVRDTTEQVLAQAALAEAQARSERSEALSGVGSWMWDVASGAVQWSAEFYKLHGVDPLSFGGTFDAYLEVVAEEDRDRLERALRASVATCTALEERYRVRLTEGRLVIVRVRAEPAFGPDGSVAGLRGVGQIVPEGEPALAAS